MNAGTYQVNISYRLNLASLRRLNTELTNIARRFRVIPVSIKVSGNITAVKSQLSDMKKRYRTISSRVNITSNINTINSQLNKLKNRKITVPVNYANSGTNSGTAPQNSFNNNGRRGSGNTPINDPNRGRSVGGRIVRGIGSRTEYGVGTTISRIPLDAITTAASYEEVMIDIKSTLEALGDGSPKQIAEMDKLIKKIGLTTKFTSTEAAQAAQMLIRNGVSAQGILDGMLNSTVTTSIVMRSDLSTTADLMTDVMAFYRDMGVSAEEASNKIVAGTLTSKFGLTDMYHALANGGTEATNYGIKLDELTAILSMISPSFKSGRKAGTSFVWFLRSLSGKSDKSAAAIEKMGLNLTKSNGKWKSARGIIQELTDKFGTLDDVQRNSAIRAIFHGEAINTVNGLIREGVAGYDVMIKKQAELNTAELARIKSTNGVSMAWKNLTSAVDAFYKAVVNDKVLNWLETFIKRLTGMLRKITKVINETVRLINSVKNVGFVTSALATIEQSKVERTGIEPTKQKEDTIVNRTFNKVVGWARNKAGLNPLPVHGSYRTKEQVMNGKTEDRIASPKPVPVIIKPDPSSSTSYMDYLDKEQKQVLRPTTSSSSTVTNSSPSKTVIFNKGAIQVNGDGNNTAHTVKDAGREIVNIIKRGTDSDGFVSFDMGGT